jgi:hypothetical protein
MVDTTQENRIAALGGEIGVRVFAFHDSHVGQVTGDDLGAKSSELVLVNFGGEDCSRGADYLCRGKSVFAVTGANVGDDGSRFPLHYGGEAFDFVCGVRAGVVARYGSS